MDNLSGREPNIKFFFLTCLGMPKILGNTRNFRFTATANLLPHDFQTEFGRVDYRKKLVVIRVRIPGGHCLCPLGNVLILQLLDRGGSIVLGQREGKHTLILFKGCFQDEDDPLPVCKNTTFRLVTLVIFFFFCVLLILCSFILFLLCFFWLKEVL